MSTMTWVAVACGGALGTVARHGVNQLVSWLWPAARYPLSTTLVNVSGCFLIGVLAGLVASDRVTLRFLWREFVFVGVLGGYTTFSTFGLDTFTLLRGGAAGIAFVNVAAQVVGGLALVWIGFALASR
jgi:fluoride exporter